MYQHLPSPVKFREDINGLRAWAVIAVLLFHFSLIGLPGGFAGVDVFFVISGYLMTTIIVGGYEKGNFSIWKFYMARARRILPALLAVIAVLLVLGWFWLPTPDYQALGAQSAYGMSFLSNIYYWRSAGYFDSAAEEKWLLHTWSLAVEAQFYLLYPIFIALIWKFWKSLKAVTIGVLVLFFASLALNLVMSNWQPTAAFYLLPTRGWELAAGALVFLIAKQYQLPKKPLSMLFWAGWLMVIGSFFLIDETFFWPGYWAVLPVLGSSLIILAYKENCFLTNNAVAQWLGDRSYSLYLWHWPLVVALYFASLQNDWSWVIGFFALSILLAHFSYQLIETPTRKYLSSASLRKEIIAIGAVGFVIGISAVSAKLFVFEGRLPKAVEVASAESNNGPEGGCFINEHGMGKTGCNFGGENIKAYLIGDSHAQAVRSALEVALLNKNSSYGLKFWGFSGCPTIKDAIHSEATKRNPYLCKKFNDDFFNFIKHDSTKTPVILVSRTSLAIHGFNGLGEKPFLKPFMTFDNAQNLNVNDLFSKKIIDSACELSKLRDVYFVRPIPEITVSPSEVIARNLMFGRGNEDIKISLDEYHKRNKLVWEAQDKAAEQCGVKILNPLSYLCDDQYCYGSRNGRSLYFDDDHLSEYGNKFLVPMFEKVFKSNPKN